MDSPSPDEMLERLKLDALADFAAGAGHEMNNPLAVISGRAQLLLRDERDIERRHALALIRTQALRVHEMIADLMLFARPPAIKTETVNLSALLERIFAEAAEDHQERTVVGELAGGQRPTVGGESHSQESAAHEAVEQPAVTAAPITLALSSRKNPIEVNADPMQLAVALKALVRNALEAAPDGGRVEVRCTQAKQATTIEVRDNGPGISADEREHIFNPFYAGRQAGRGLGLGLSKAWRIITLHGGRIDVADAPGGGASFTIRLPR